MLYRVIIVLSMLVFAFIYATVLTKVAKFVYKDKIPSVLKNEARNSIEKKSIIIIAAITFATEIIFAIPIWLLSNI